MNRYLLTYSDNWADEMDIDGHVVLTEREYREFKKSLEQCDGFCFCIGTNEDIDYDDGSDAEDVISVQKITEEEYKVLENLGLLSAGFAEDFIEQLMQSVEDGDEEEDEDY